MCDVNADGNEVVYKVRIKCTREVVVGFAVLCVITSITELGSDGLMRHPTMGYRTCKIIRCFTTYCTKLQNKTCTLMHIHTNIHQQRL